MSGTFSGKLAAVVAALVNSNDIGAPCRLLTSGFGLALGCDLFFGFGLAASLAMGLLHFLAASLACCSHPRFSSW